MKTLRLRAGFTLLETMLFFGIFGVISTTIVAVYIATQESRVRQQRVAEVEQRGVQILEVITKTIERSEAIISPIATKSGSTLVLQLASNQEYPTLFNSSGGNLLMIQKNEPYMLLSDKLTLSNLHFRNLASTNVITSFDLSIIVPTSPITTFKRHFESTATLFPSYQLQAGGCGSCPAPVCTSHILHWSTCEAGTCTDTSSAIRC